MRGLFEEGMEWGESNRLALYLTDGALAGWHRYVSRKTMITAATALHRRLLSALSQ